MKTECKNNSYNTFPSSIALINLENSRVQVCFFYWHFSTHPLYLLCTRIPSFIWYNNIRSNIYFNVVMVIFVIIVKFSRYLIVFSIIWLTKNRLVELLARWNSSNVYRVTNGGGEGREGDYQAQKLERDRARGSDGSLSSLGNTVPRIIYFLLDQTASLSFR